MIENGKNKLIGNTTLPNMAETIKGWFLPIEFGVVTNVLVDFEQTIVIERVQTQGVVQPPQTEDIEIQPEGIRNWEWLEIHCLPNFQVKINDFIFYKEKKYKVMKKENFADYGYMRYLVMEAYDE